ncbi:Zn(II)2Cys6 transcription factor [Aspergillus puulaauensis]|uniref:Zn(2)-C6 fungal-type domain-containing protein n=1 Tax=Aspergillus puulaauensis TaxID=1220207 RepID=A0A7R8AQ45_9EURO|nr:uncharacterized protein APUU_60867S [Aspergillus puulaauensis]BCS27819.1 hypothetical protein APUU_60867S [Aspergillus puulaauensis]
MSTPRARRSHAGCWTCKAKRRKCDSARPTCRVCSQHGIPCEGYEVRLRWGSGIASRGHFTGAEAPVDTSIPPRVPGRRRDRNRGRRREEEGETQAQAAEGSSSQDSHEDLAQPYSICRVRDIVQIRNGFFKNVGICHAADDCTACQNVADHVVLSSGINTLHSTTVHDEQTLLKPRLPVLCQQSEALYTICIALQASLSREPTARSLEYLDIGLNKFRAELSTSEHHLEDGTLTAGLLLCTIGVMHGIPWTMHLRGMYSILRMHDVEGAHHQERSAFRAHLFEVMGIMDLPTFSIGRQHSQLGFWKEYCCKGDRTPGIETGVEVVTGLPRSLVTIFAFIGEGSTETDFWDWSGAQGTFTQCQLWEAYRLAGVLVVRHGGPGFPRPSNREAMNPAMQSGASLTSTTVIVLRLLSCVDAVCRGSLDPECWDTLIINAISYPVSIAGLQSDVLQKDPILKEFIRKSLRFTTEGPFLNRQYGLLLDLLEEYWAYPVGTVDIDRLARTRGVELGLF